METRFNRNKFIAEIRRYVDRRSQDELAAAAGISQGAIGFYLNPPKNRTKIDRVPRADTLARIANALDVPVSDFYTDAASPERELELA